MDPAGIAQPGADRGGCRVYILSGNGSGAQQLLQEGAEKKSVGGGRKRNPDGLGHGVIALVAEPTGLDTEPPGDLRKGTVCAKQTA